MAILSSRPVQSSLRIARFLCTDVLGASSLAAFGLLLFAGGGLSLLLTPAAEATTRVTAADLEARGPGDHPWLEVTDAFLFWPLGHKRVTVYEDSKKEEATGYYVPLVSKGVLDRWTTVHEANKGDPDKAIYPCDDCRVLLLKMSPAAFKGAFPKGAPDDSTSTPYQAAGRAGTYRAEKDDVREALTKQIQNLKPERIIVLESGAPPPALASYGWLMVLALPFFVPLGFVLVRRMRSAPAAKAAPAPAAAAAPVEAIPLAGAYYYLHGGERFGPVSFEQLKELAAAGKLAPDDSVWQEGMRNWVRASTVPDLFPS